MEIDLRLRKAATFWNQAEWELLNDIYIADVHVPKGTITDGATMPRYLIFVSFALIVFTAIFDLWFIFILSVIGGLVASLFPAFGSYTAAAIVHDQLLTANSDREIADNKMKEIMDLMGTNPLYSKLIYFGVRLFSAIKRFLKR